MQSAVGQGATTRDFFDRLNDPTRLVLRLGGLLLWITFTFTVFLWVDDKLLLLLCWTTGVVVLLALPRIVRGGYLAYRGAPALRINEAGFWARDWSYLGWISWRDVASVEIVSGTTHQLVVHLRDKEFAQLAGHDQVSVMLARLAGFLFFSDAGSNTLRLISSLELASRWEDLTATLDPILAANGVPSSEKRTPA